MSEKEDENSRVSSGGETERKGWQTTFDVYVGRIPPDWTKEKLMEIFQPFGEIKSVDLRTGPDYYNGQQIAFIRFPKEEMAKCAVDSLLGHPVENVKLQINMAQRSKYKENKDRQGNLNFSQPRNKAYSELKRTNQTDLRRGRTRQFGRNEMSEYGGGYGISHGQKKELWTERQKSREEQERVVLVTEVETPVRFWGQIAKATVAHNLSTASEELQLYCPTGLKVADNSHQKNKIYGGLYPVDNLWYRCAVVRFLPQGMVTVRYVDFGNTETIRKETLVELPPSLADARPFAQLYHLADCAVSTDPGANEMTVALGIEQLKNLILGNLVNVKYFSENSHGGVNVTVSFPGEAGKTVNEVMLDGGCVQKLRPRYDKGTIERSVAEKPLNDDNSDSSSDKSSKDKQGIDGLKLTIKFQSETICNLNKLFETVKQQNDYLSLELDQAIKIKRILTAVKDLRESRCAPASTHDRTANIDVALSLVTDTENRLASDQVESFKKLCSSSDALKIAQDSVRNCGDKEKLKEVVEHRNTARQEVLKDTKNFLEEISTLNVKDRVQKLEEAVKKLSVFHHRYDWDESLEEAVEKYKNWKENPQQSDVKSLRQNTDDLSRKLAGEFIKIGKMLDPDDGFTLEDCGTVDANSVALQFSEAVAAEVKQNQECGDTDEMQVLAGLIKCLKKELHKEIADVEQLRLRGDECLKLQGDLEAAVNQQPDVTKMVEIRKNLKAVKSKFRHKLADKKDLEECDETVDETELQKVEKDLSDLRYQLHSLLVEEKIALNDLAKDAIENFPELPVQYPEFGLQKFIASNGLVKQGWELSYYSHGEIEKLMTSSDGEAAFVTAFNGEKCLLKEFSLEGMNDFDSFEAQAIAYSVVKHSNLMRLDALFYDKTHRKAFIQFPYYETSLRKWLESSPSDQAKRDVICDVIRALFALHNTGITHGSVVLDNIFVDSNGRGVLGEYCFIFDTQQRVSSTAELLLQNSAPVSCDTSPVFDMFCLGEIAWVVFLGDEPVPRDLQALEKISRSKAVSFMLTYLLALNGGGRPTASQFIQHLFFTDENYFDIMDKTAPHDQITPEVPVTEQKSPPSENALPGENSLADKSTAPDIDTSPEVDILPDECPLQKESTPTAESTQKEKRYNQQDENSVLTEKSTLHEETVPLGESELPEESEPPEKSGLPDESEPSEESTLPDAQPQFDEKLEFGKETIFKDETPIIEEALPEEYAVTQRKPLSGENDFAKEDLLDKNPPENTTEEKIQNEVVNGDTQE